LKPEILERQTTQNVVAFLEGSDPKLKEEIVLLSAHYDHVGMAPAPPANAPNKDRIFNGADDDGSGTVGILNLAEAYAAVTRPRRSLLFVWHCGEERGLWGSDYFVQHPTKPLDKIAVNINIDMIGRNSEDKPENSNHVFIIGVRRTSQDLTDLVYKTNEDRMRLDETDNANYFMRSDHFNYARNHIPVVFFFTGVHKDYHKVTDEVQLIQFDKMKKILDIIFEVGLEVANRETRPTFIGQGF
jgi:Zn-dependent M28 family amino/carboxypeptidase